MIDGVNSKKSTKNNNISKGNDKDTTEKTRKKISKKTKIIILTTVIIILVIGFIIYNLFNFMVREEIIMNIEPSYNLLQLRFGDNYSLPLSLSIDNNWLCTADCDYTLTDISSDKILDMQSFQVKNHKELSISKDYIFSDKGYGQKIIQYLIECHNNPTNTCPSDNNTYRRISTYIINYSPSISQESIMSQLSAEYTAAAVSIYDSGNMLSKAVLISQIPELKTDDLSDRKSDTEKMFSSVSQDLYSVSTYWKDDEFDKAGDYFIQKTITQSANNLYESSNYLLNESMSRIDAHNKIIMDQDSMIAKLILLNKSATYYPDNSGYSEFKQDMMLGSELININTKNILTKNFDSYESMISDIENADNVINRISNNIDSKIQQSKKDFLDIYLADALTCIMDNGVINGSGINTSVDCRNMLKYSLDNYSIQQRCDLAQEAVSGLNNIVGVGTDNSDDNNTSTDNITNTDSSNNVSVSNYHEEQSLVMRSLIIYYNESINDTDAKSEVNDYYNRLYQLLSKDYNYTFIREYYPEHYNNSIASQYSIDLLNIKDNVEEILNSCHRPEMRLSVAPFNQALIKFPEITPPEEKNDTLPKPKNMCCLYGVCTECCPGCVAQDPLILLHGHSFNEKNSAHQSTEIFNMIEQKLVDEHKYLSIGVPGNILYDPEIMGSYNIPILMKPTYYITSWNSALGITISEGKSGNIDTYALRLKEDIDYAKIITKKDKIDIITHSMGGLVVRRYIQIFGSDSINKLIMIGTPNLGINDKEYKYCKLFGQINECDDMHTGSLFLNKLNDAKEQQKMPETYIIIGSGCDMNGEDGDGVVTVKNAQLVGYKPIIINGTCQGTTLLHNEVLDINKYPEVYMNITQILEK
jgi:hypothetical protein